MSSLFSEGDRVMYLFSPSQENMGGKARFGIVQEVRYWSTTGSHAKISWLNWDEVDGVSTEPFRYLVLVPGPDTD